MCPSQYKVLRSIYNEVEIRSICRPRLSLTRRRLEPYRSGLRLCVGLYSVNIGRIIGLHTISQSELQNMPHLLLLLWSSLLMICLVD